MVGDFSKNTSQGISQKLEAWFNDKINNPFGPVFGMNDSYGKWFKEFTNASPEQRVDMLASVTNDALWQIPIIAASDGTVKLIGSVGATAITSTKAYRYVSKEEFEIIDSERISRAVNAMNLYKKALNINQKEIYELSKVDNGDYVSLTKLIEFQDSIKINVELKTKLKAKVL
jgi:hypothetical protein